MGPTDYQGEKSIIGAEARIAVQHGLSDGILRSSCLSVMPSCGVAWASPPVTVQSDVGDGVSKLVYLISRTMVRGIQSKAGTAAGDNINRLRRLRMNEV